MKIEDIKIGMKVYFYCIDSKLHSGTVVENNWPKNVSVSNAVCIKTDDDTFFFKPENLYETNDVDTNPELKPGQIQWIDPEERPTESCNVLTAVFYDYWRYRVAYYEKKKDCLHFFMKDNSTMSWDDFMDVGMWYCIINNPKL